MRARTLTHKTLVALASALMLVVWQPPAHAARPLVMPLEAIAVQMESLEVNIAVLRSKEKETQASRAIASVQSRARLRRLDVGVRSARLAFPLRDLGGRGEEFGRYDPIAFELLRFTINRRASQPALSLDGASAVLDVGFLSGSDVVQVGTNYILNGVNVGPWRVFRYPLHITAGWAGDVGEARFAVDLLYPANELTVDRATSSPGVKFAGNTARWQFGPLEPQPSDDFVAVVLSQPAWQRIQATEARVRRRSGAQPWLELARAYREVIVPGERAPQIGEAYVGLMIEAYLGAAQRSRQPDAVHLELASALAALYAPPYPAQVAEAINAALNRALESDATRPAAKSLAEQILSLLDQRADDPTAQKQAQSLRGVMLRAGLAPTPSVLLTAELPVPTSTPTPDALLIPTAVSPEPSPTAQPTATELPQAPSLPAQPTATEPPLLPPTLETQQIAPGEGALTQADATAPATTPPLATPQPIEAAQTAFPSAPGWLSLALVYVVGGLLAFAVTRRWLSGQ